MLPVAILAGGLATRLRPLTYQLQKALVEIDGEPFIAHQLRLLHLNRINRIVICAAYLGEMIQAFVGDGTRFGVQVSFSFDGSHLLGTGGAIKKALSLLGDTFFVLYGDSYLPCDYAHVQTFHETTGKLSLMTVFRNDGRWDRSNVEFVDGRIAVYNKRKQSLGMHHIDYGLGIFKAAAFATVRDDRPTDLAAVYQDLLSRGELAGCEVKQRFYEIGSFEGLEETRRYLETRVSPHRSAR
jgi:NDP-sugar pyrophosphorylase family protein